jgi:hypothetical protein
MIELKTDLQIFMEKHQEEIEVNPKKRKLYSDEERDTIIQKLINGKKKSQNWKEGMSKYSTITYTGKKWILQSYIFNESAVFSTKEGAEAYYEKIVEKYDIGLEYITRNGYHDGIDTNAAVEGLLQFAT